MSFMIGGNSILVLCSRIYFGISMYLALVTCAALADDTNNEQHLNPCNGHTADVIVRFEQATANLYSNVIKSDGSLRSVLEKVLTYANAEISKAKPPADLCPYSCTAVREPGYVVSTVPKERLRGYENEHYCADMKARTEANPIYTAKDFSSIEQFSSWFNDYSRGNGEDGKKLYSQCDADCSPEYRTAITRNAKSLSAKVQVVCGHARDKSDNSYVVTLIARFSCEPA
jgi:hypothetical protein